MTQFDSVETRRLTLVNNADVPVVDFDIIANTAGEQARIRVKSRSHHSMEIWSEPGDDAHIVGNIVNQFGMFGPLPKDGKGRARITTSLVTDAAGGLSAVIDSSTTDPSGHIGQKDAPPLIINAGEGKGQYVIMYPSDGTIDFQDRANGISTGRISFKSLVKHLRRVPK